MNKAKKRRAGFFKSTCILFLGAVFALGSIAIVGCSSSSSDPTPPPAPTLLKITATIQQDEVPAPAAATFGATPVNATVTFTGPNKDDIRNASGTLITTATAVDGKVVVYVYASLDPSDLVPVDFTIVAVMSGYLDNSMRVIMTSTADPGVTVTMVNLEETPSGVTADVNEEGKAEGGVVQTEVKIETPSTDKQGAPVGTASVDVAAGTEAKLADGSSAEGDLVTTVVVGDANSEAAIAAIPGGTNVTAVGSSGAEEEGTLEVVGYVTVEMKDETGKQVKAFDPPLPVVMTILAGTINPNTGVAIADKDVLSLYSYDAATALWTYVEDVTAKVNADGNFDMSFTVSHLTTFSFGRIRQTKCLAWFNYTISDFSLLAQGKINATVTVGGVDNTKVLSSASGTFKVQAAITSGCTATFSAVDPAGEWNIVSPSGSYGLDGGTWNITFAVQTGG